MPEACPYKPEVAARMQLLPDSCRDVRSLWEWRRPAAFAKRGYVGNVGDKCYGLAGWRRDAASPRGCQIHDGGETCRRHVPTSRRWLRDAAFAKRGYVGNVGDKCHGLARWRRDAASPRVCRIRAGFKPDSSRGADAPGCIPTLPSEHSIAVRMHQGASLRSDASRGRIAPAIRPRPVS